MFTIRDAFMAGEASGTSAKAPAFGVRGGRMEVFGRRVPLPESRRWRVAIGVALIVGGLLGFLPILGFWMVPLGLLVLSIDFAIVRRMRRRSAVRWGRWRGRGRLGIPEGRTAADVVARAARGTARG